MENFCLNVGNYFGIENFLSSESYQYSIDNSYFNKKKDKKKWIKFLINIGFIHKNLSNFEILKYDKESLDATPFFLK